MITALASTNPNPSMGNEARTFDRFVGTWDCDFSFHLDDGSVRHQRGELLFGWILDVARCRTSGSRTRRTARRIARSARRSGSSIRLSSRIVLEGTDSDGLPIRWSFNEMKPDSFVWRGEKSRDGGKTWKLEEEHHMTRRSGSRRSGSSSEHANDPRLDMIRMLGSSNPSQSLGSEAQLFDRFVGAWDLDCVFYDPK